MFRIFFLGVMVFMISCQAADRDQSGTPPEMPAPEAVAFTGEKLYAPEEGSSSLRVKDSLLQLARKDFMSDSLDISHIIWLGRRTAYLNRFQGAIQIYSNGLQHFPDSPRIYRHRGHRYITTRQLDLALADFAKAAELIKDWKDPVIEPDGLPNKLNIPLSNVQFNIWYHYGLAWYLKGDFARAADCYEKCMAFSVNDDLKCATVDWLYMTYRRLGNDQAAARLLEGITENMEIIENDGYFERLMLYKGQRRPEELLDLENPSETETLKLVTQGYGVGNWYLYNGQNEKAFDIFEKVVKTGYWPAFGYIAAEAELSRRKE